MYPVSAAYRHAMRRQVRDQGYVRLQFGIFDASAPGDAAVPVPPGTWYSDASVLDGGESPVRVSYATFEGDRMRLDGTQRLLPESGAEAPFPDGAVTEAVSALSPREREAVLLRYYQGMKLREVAQALRISENAAKARLHRANEHLRARLERWYFDDD